MRNAHVVCVGLPAGICYIANSVLADHVRLYGLDLFGRIAAQELQVRRYSHQENLADFDEKKHGVNFFEDFILAFKV